MRDKANTGDFVKGQQPILIFGLGIVVAGFVYGFAYNFGVDHTPLLKMKEAPYETTFLQLAQGIDSEEAAALPDALNQIKEKTVSYTRAIGAHTHAIYLGVLVVVLGVLYPLVRRSAGWLRQVVRLFIAGACIYPTGLTLQVFGYVLAGEALAVIGSGSVIFSLALICMQLLKFEPDK